MLLSLMEQTSIALAGTKWSRTSGMFRLLLYSVGLSAKYHSYTPQRLDCRDYSSRVASDEVLRGLVAKTLPVSSLNSRAGLRWTLLGLGQQQQCRA